MMRKKKSAHYNVTVNVESDAELCRIARKHNLKVSALIRRFCVLGVYESMMGPFFYIDKNGANREVELFPCKQEKKLQLWKIYVRRYDHSDLTEQQAQ
ncbi:MAG: hypothetical protein E6J34_02130 [Chloroflexi bacterium]|nr:MAG: hypothetical protein E6J34_02130 [Chloroflexota bacterium]